MLDRGAMLRRPKCLCCLPIDMACFIFGVFSAVLSGFGVVVFALSRTWFGAVTGDEAFDEMWDNSDSQIYFQDKIYRQKMLDYTTAMVAMLFLFVCCLISFIFSVFLCYGTHKRRPGFVKAYLVYGVVINILMMVGAILYSWLMQDIVGGSIVLIISGVYSTILLMVQRTHEIIRAEQNRNSAQLLCPEPMKA